MITAFKKQITLNDVRFMVFEMNFPQIWGGIAGRAGFKEVPENFRVSEELGFELTGEGEHLFLFLEKSGHNTMWLCRLLARYFDVTSRELGYAGLKDRIGVTRQWFSVHLPGRKVDDQPLQDMLSEHAIKILRLTRHSKKLRTGALRGNHFVIRLTHFTGCRKTLEQRAEQVVAGGFPNWFGEQRFGHQGHNLELATAFLEQGRPLKRESRGYAISAARSWLFNQVLKQRIVLNTWDMPQPGDVFIFRNNRSVILPELVNESAIEKWQAGELHLSGPLWGAGKLLSQGIVRDLELSAVNTWQNLATGLAERARLVQERRALRQWVYHWEMKWQADDVLLSFFLPRGSYATALLKELVDYTGEPENMS